MNLELIEKAKNYVEEILTPVANYDYHNFGHALEVMQRAIYLGQKEGISDEELEILALASLFHDTGFIRQYDVNEIFGAGIARDYLEKIGYDEAKINLIQKIILFTDPKLIHPKNILEEIIEDSDLDNLGREDFFEQGKLVKNELEKAKRIVISEEDRNSSTLFFIENHKFYTDTQREERENQRKINENILREMTKNSKLLYRPNY